MTAQHTPIGRRYTARGPGDVALSLECQGCGAGHTVEAADPITCLSVARRAGWQPMDGDIGRVWCLACQGRPVQGDMSDTEAA